MNTLIFKTNINSDREFTKVKNTLSKRKKVEECTIDLDDIDRVLRILSDSFTIAEIEKEINILGFYCKELDG